MKKYVILTPEIGNMGGGQMYVYNKCKYLADHDWKVVVFFFKDSKILIEGLKEVSGFSIPYLGWGIQYVSPKVRNIVIKDICSKVCYVEGDEVVVESQLFNLTFWGELLSSRLNAKHILNCLEEDIPSYSSNVARFFDFKLKRWECLNACEKSLRRLFQEHYKEDYKHYEYRSEFYCSNVLDTNIEDTFELKEADSTILSIGRLDKPYILTMVDQIKEFVLSKSDSKFNVIFIGGSENGNEEEVIKLVFAKCVNINLYFYGYLFPVPSCLVRKADVAIATSNSVLVSYEQGIPTIAVDASDFFAIGIYGVTTNNKVFRYNEQKVAISDVLKSVLCDKITVKNHSIIESSFNNDIDHFKDQIDFLYKGPSDQSYYDVIKIFDLKELIFSNIKRLIYNTFKN